MDGRHLDDRGAPTLVGGRQPDDPPSGNWAVTYDQGPQVTLMDTSGIRVGVMYNCNLQTLRAYDAEEFDSCLNGKIGQWVYPPVGESVKSSDIASRDPGA